MDRVANSKLNIGNSMTSKYSATFSLGNGAQWSETHDTATGYINNIKGEIDSIIETKSDCGSIEKGRVAISMVAKVLILSRVDLP